MIVPSLDAVRRLPRDWVVAEVQRTMTLQSFVPDDQQKKLAMSQTSATVFRAGIAAAKTASRRQQMRKRSGTQRSRIS